MVYSIKLVPECRVRKEMGLRGGGWTGLPRVAESRIVEQLQEALSQLSEAEADKLTRTLERDKLMGGKLPHDLILAALRPRLQSEDLSQKKRGGAPTPVRHLCWPFEELLVNRRDGVKHRGRVARTSIMPVWDWLAQELAPDALGEISQHIVDHTLAKDEEQLEASVQVLHATCAEAIRLGLEEARLNPKTHRALVERLGGEEVLADANEMRLLLAVAPHLNTFKAGLPKSIDELTPEIAGNVRDLFDVLAKAQPDAAPYAAVIAMRHLQKPWQIFRIVKGVAHTNTDVLISRTDIAIVGELLLCDMEEAVDCLETVDPSEEPDPVLERLNVFTHISRGITEEIGVRRDGAWATRLMSSRGAVSEIIRERMDKAPSLVYKALPMRSTGRFGRSGPKRPDFSREIDSNVLHRAVSTVKFLEGARRFAQAGSFVGAINAAISEIDRYLEDYERTIIDELRSEDEALRERGESYLDAVSAIVEVFRNAEEAALLHKRGLLARDSAIA